ncbi:MAG: hypothetical protein LBK66_05765 [Spirochaetaceae bacterium]|nr:hypothetical protein [Spirochaetaceae bacterium]
MPQTVLEQTGNVYAGTVALNVSTLDIIAAATHPNAQVLVYDGGVAKPAAAANSVSVQASAPSLNASKTITVRVTAEDGKTTGDSIINIFRDGSNIVYNAEGGISKLVEKEDGSLYEVHTFMVDTSTPLGGQKTHTLTFTQRPADNKVEVLVVAGGGGGGLAQDGAHRGGGGGAGGYIYVPAYPITADSITVKVGAGGTKPTSYGGAYPNSSKGGTGGKSEFGSTAADTITANGGGGGASHAENSGLGNSGGSGGGSTWKGNGAAAQPGTAPAGISAVKLGNRGGNIGNGNTNTVYTGTGGGGAGGTGGDATGENQATAGGAGTTSSISAQAQVYARGGNAGGGTGADGTAGTGNGGSGGTSASGNLGKGGSGIVIVRWPWVAPAAK